MLPARQRSFRIELLWAVLAVLANAPSVARASSNVTLRDFSGAVYLSSAEIDRQLGIGWTRQDFSWGAIEPERGKWDWAKYDRVVEDAHAQSVEVLPVLDFTAPWAAKTAGERFYAPQRVEDWEDYVYHVVARYSQPPFNLRYFQVWNEPTREAGFWKGADHEFVDQIYLPAAKIIRSHKCYVVFGGWPMNGGLARFNDVLTYHDAWKFTDIVDVHYYGNAGWQPLYDRWVKTGQCKGIWQTEVGFVGDFSYLPSLYLWSLHWALQSGWNDPDQYKVFWYAIGGTGANADRCLTTLDSSGKTVLTEQGRRLAVINDVLGGGALSLFDQFSSVPPIAPSTIETRPMALGFRVGDHRVVIAFLLDRDTCERSPAIRVRADVGSKPARIELVTVSGERQALTGSYRSGRVDVSIPLQLVRQTLGNSRSAFAYLELDGP